MNQIDEWVEGRPVHNAEKDLCCPDFSCCKPDLLRPRKEREQFRDASEEEQHSMMFVFLSQAFPDAKIYRAGTERD